MYGIILYVILLQFLSHRFCLQRALTMQCIIPGSNIKVFGRAVHALARIGDELYVDPERTAVSLRTVNSSRSAYASVEFQPTFFAQYQCGAGAGGQEPVKCKVALKACLSVFRSLASLDKSVERCRIALEESNSRMVVQLECKHKIKKTYHIAFIECETLQAVYSPSEASNRLTAAPRLLVDAAANFLTGQEEVTLAVSHRQLGLRNYTDDEPDPGKAIRTALALNPAEFDGYSIGAECEVTFCLRELRAVLLFSEPLAAPLTVNFDGPGRPIVFCCSAPSTLEAHFVLATLAERTESQAGSQPAPAAGVTAHTGNGDHVSAAATSHNGTLSGIVRPNSRCNGRVSDTPTPRLNPGQPACTSTPLDLEPGAGDGPPPSPPSAAADGDDAIPGTPPAKRAKFTFQRCFNLTMDPLRVPGHERVLAPDSDED
ncbi:cell cycle checkpoint control protein RAD9A-like isoform X4 [Amphibalanus amphitrite]|uniref:cell cycle checkpoint control protein RAD9A-like isoform X4 n=1 Tax=Amphibalanus amphitrite TaxID=1232801 RepID=UPI001C90B46E|nr:cell cycle checkpoint control protein RAD9A-like isoform X4 [Amphibalanus amphitrite]